MPGETSRSAVLERLQAHVGDWVNHATALELSYTRSGTSDRCVR